VRKLPLCCYVVVAFCLSFSFFTNLSFGRPSALPLFSLSPTEKINNRYSLRRDGIYRPLSKHKLASKKKTTQQCTKYFVHKEARGIPTVTMDRPDTSTQVVFGTRFVCGFGFWLAMGIPHLFSIFSILGIRMKRGGRFQ